MFAEHFDLLTEAEGAEKLRVSPSTVDRLRTQGEIAWVPVGRQIRFRAEALTEYMQRTESRAASAPKAEAAPRARTRAAPAPGPAPGGFPRPVSTSTSSSRSRWTGRRRRESDESPRGKADARRSSKRSPRRSPPVSSALSAPGSTCARSAHAIERKIIFWSSPLLDREEFPPIDLALDRE
jgi:excisionase family DNA binding protein